MKLPHMQVSTVVVGGDGRPTDSFGAFLDAVQGKLRWTGSVIYGTSAQRTTSTTRGYQAPQNIADGSLYLETDTGLIYQLRSTVAGDNSGNAKVRSAAWVGLWGSTLTDQTLSAASTTINPPAAGSRWVVILRQDGTGGRAIVWGAGVKAASVAIDTTASTISTFQFEKSGADWIMIGQPSTGMVP